MKPTKNTYLALIAVLLTPMVAAAVPVEIAGTASSDGTWDIATLTGAWQDVSSQLMTQEWWLDVALADTFRDALGDTLGLFDQGFGPVTPLFAYEGGDIWNATAIQSNGFPAHYNCFGGPDCEDGSYGRVWAVATRVSVPEPGTLALFVIGLFGIGYSRYRK